VADEAAKARVHAQADQLAVHLRSRQKELDHRESQVNARLAVLDRDMRTASLWLKEREAEFTERAELLDSRQANLERRERELDRRVRDMARAEAERSDAEKCSRRKEIELAECRVEEARAEAENLRERLRRAHQELSEDARQQRRRLADEQRAALAEIEKQREAVRRRGEHVDKAHAALEQLRGELGRMHRETLEIRLATEELWVQLSGAAPPAALTKSLSGIRSKLADHYRLANAELQQQKQELEAIRRQLAEQYDKVLRQKQQYDHWTQQHRQDAEADASRLAAREAELHQLQAELNDCALKWQAQRLDYEQQIRRLKAESETVTA
jgi:exonuclease SbcC